MHHFAHAPKIRCEYACESSLHLAAKDILSKAKKIIIPPIYVDFPNSNAPAKLVCEAQRINIDEVKLEERFPGFIPDVVVYSGEKKFFIEIYVTHSVTEEKLKKIKESEISTIEINLSKYKKMISAEELKKILLNDNEAKKWMFNTKWKEYLNKFIQMADEREIKIGKNMIVEGCPKATPDKYGRRDANYVYGCLRCKYCIKNAENTENSPYPDTYKGMKILCSARNEITSEQNLHTTKQPMKY